MNDYQSFHPGCVDDRQLPDLAGDVVVSLKSPLFLKGPEPDHVFMFEAGALLHVASAVPSVRAAARDHIAGTVKTSDLRFAVGQMLGLVEAGRTSLKSAGEKQIDGWIAEHTVISVREHSGQAVEAERRTGWFDNARAVWERAHDGAAE